MLARRSQLVLPSGARIDTPLLIPSASSKGAGRTGGPEGDPGSFQQLEVIEATGPALRAPSTLLISSYDLHHGLIQQERFIEPTHPFPIDLLFVDSGSYETLSFEGDPPFIQNVEPLPWDEAMFVSTIERLDLSGDVVLINFDRRDDYDLQIAAAEEFFAAHNGGVSDLLLKPPNDAPFHDFDQLTTLVRRLDAFQIVGVTEKELGLTPLDRLAGLAKLRTLLDEGGVARPIHVFGGLDPLWTPLYHAAGAEIMDGLSWWRYAFQDGTATYRDVAVLRDLNLLAEPLETGRAIVRQTNLERLALLEDDLIAYTDTHGDWAHFDRAAILEQAHQAMVERMKEGTRGR